MAADAKPGGGAKAGGGAPGGGGGKKGGGGGKKDKKAVVYKHATSGRKYPLVHLLPSAPSELRAAARQAGANTVADASVASRHVDAAGNIVSDDERMRPIYAMVNAKQVDYTGVAPEVLDRPPPTPGAGGVGEELWQRQDELDSRIYEGAIDVPEALKGKVRVVDDDFDAAAQTDIEVDVTPPSKRRDWDALARRMGGVAPVNRAGGEGKVDSMGLDALYRLRRSVGAAVHSGFTDTETTPPLPGTDGRPRQPTTARLAWGANGASHGGGAGGGVMEDGMPSSTPLTGRVGPARAYAEFPDDLNELLEEDGGGGGGDRRGGGGGRGGGGSAITDQGGVAAMLDGATPTTTSTAPRSGAGAADGVVGGTVSRQPPTPEQLAELAARRAAMRAATAKPASPGDGDGGVVAVGDDVDVPILTSVVYDSDQDELVARPSYLPTIGAAASKIAWPVARSAAEEEDAMLGEQAAAIMQAASSASGSGAAAGSSGGKISVDALIHGPAATRPSTLDVRDQIAPEITRLMRRQAAGLSDTDSEMERLVDMAADYEEGSRIAPAFGDKVSHIPATILEELATPFDFADHHQGQPYPEPVTAREAYMTPQERMLDEQRKGLRDLIERPLPIVTRPLWPLHAMIACVDQVQQVLAGGMAASTRTMIVVGNGMGGVGYGIGKHKEPFQAVKMALAHAQRDMIHLSLHKKQLYHDIIGKKNNVYVVVRSLPATSAFSNAQPLLMDIFELAGIDHISAKVFGSKRREAYQVVQALFDAFQNHRPPEVAATARGVRMQWMGADRHNPRYTYPFSPAGPRHVPVNSRWANASNWQRAK